MKPTLCIILVLLVIACTSFGSGYGGSEGAPQVVDAIGLDVGNSFYLWRAWSDGTVDATRYGTEVCPSSEDQICNAPVIGADPLGRTLAAAHIIHDPPQQAYVTLVWNDGSATHVKVSVDICTSTIDCSSEPIGFAPLGDTNWDGSVDVTDLINVITGWGTGE